MLHQLISVLFFGATVLIVGCSRSPSHFAKEVAGICPSGWQVSASNNVIVLRRECAVWIMGKIAKPPSMSSESVIDYFKRAGGEIHYELRLRFVSLLPRLEYEKLKSARAQAAARFSKGASGKFEYTRWQKDYENCQVPVFFTKDYSVFVDRWADRGAIIGQRMEPRFIELYPPEAASEIEALIKRLKKVFKEYEGSDI